MAGLRDRPLMRDALLAGGLIAASCVTALIAVDRGQLPRRHFGSVASAPMHSASDDSASGSSSAATHVRRGASARGTPSRQIGAGPYSSKKKVSDMTLVVMVPDLPRENAGTPPSGVWNEQGSAGPVTSGNAPAAGLIAMSSTGGPSLPLTSPTGRSSGGAPVMSGGGISPPAVPNPGGGHPPVVPPNVQPSHSGFVLLAGGQGNGQFALSSAELFNPVTNEFAAASPMKDARTNHTATVLPGGKILVAGGEGSGLSLSSAELYDPASGTFSAVASKMDAARAEHTATLISGCKRPVDGKVLIAGGVTGAGALGSTLRSAELYDPATGTFTATGAMNATRARHSATLLASGPLAGNVLVAGGISDESGGDVATAELYDPLTGQFTATGRMSTPREGHSATWLSRGVVAGALAGSVLVAGGGDVSAPSDSAEVFNPQTGTFAPVGAMTSARTLLAAVLLGNGKVLIAGGQSGETEFLLSAELFDPKHANFVATGNMNNLHAGATAIALENGNALIAGGRSNGADLYNTAAGTFSPMGTMVTDLAESTATLVK